MENYNNNMNNFNNDQNINNEMDNQDYKEKNMYLLHLDGARIIILSAILIGIVAVTFLIGMNFSNSSNDKVKNEDIFANNVQYDASLERNSEKKDIDELFDNKNDQNIDLQRDNINANKSLQSNNSDLLFPENNKNNQIVKKDSLPENNKDVLTSENVKEIIPATKPAAKKVVTKRKPTKNKKIAQKGPAKRKKVTKRKRVKRKSRVVAASAPVKRKDIRPITTKKKNIDRKGYSIQIVSYNKNSKAKREANRLKNMNYAAYTDNANVNGKRYYRVLVGPITSKRKAIELLNEIQNKPRYENSYIIHQ